MRVNHLILPKHIGRPVRTHEGTIITLRSNMRTIEFAHMMGLEVCTTPYYSPESNGMAESFVRTLSP